MAQSEPKAIITEPVTETTDTDPEITKAESAAGVISNNQASLMGGTAPAPEVVTLTADEAAAVAAAAETDPRVGQALGIFANLTALEVTPTEVIAAKEVLTTMSVRKPKKNEFVMAQDIAFTTFLYQDDDEGVFYFIEPTMREHFIAGTVVKVLVPAVNQLGHAFIWPVPADDGQSSRNNTWNESHRAAYQQAKIKWTKMVSDRVSRVYRVYEASGKLAEPKFCKLPFNQQIALAFRGISTISDTDHPVLRAMRGDIP